MGGPVLRARCGLYRLDEKDRGARIPNCYFRIRPAIKAVRQAGRDASLCGLHYSACRRGGFAVVSGGRHGRRSVRYSAKNELAVQVPPRDGELIRNVALFFSGAKVPSKRPPRLATSLIFNRQGPPGCKGGRSGNGRCLRQPLSNRDPYGKVTAVRVRAIQI